MPRLDGLRAIAVAGVLFEHFAPSGFIRSLSPGGAGVSLFFVLSGFLITRILIGYRDTKVHLLTAAKHFYWRRLCRLSPPYYLIILIAALAGFAAMRSEWWIHALYLTNFQLGLTGEWHTTANHFWSLSVEEQFYVLWFFVVMLTPPRHFITAILIAFLATLVFRAFIYVTGLPPLTTVLLPGNIASLAAGALLTQASGPLSNILLSRKWLVATGVVFAALSLSMRYVDLPRAIFYPFAASAFFGCLIYACARPGRDAWLDWLKQAPLRYMGKISYGIFIYHSFVAAWLIAYLHLPTNSWLTFIVLCAASIGVAHLSWVFLEKPILEMKEFVTLPQDQAPNRAS